MQKAFAAFVALVVLLTGALLAAESEVPAANIMKVIVKTQDGKDTVIFTDKAIAWRNGIMVYEGTNELFVLANGKQIERGSYAPSKPSTCTGLSCMSEENSPIGLLKLIKQFPIVNPEKRTEDSDRLPKIAKVEVEKFVAPKDLNIKTEVIPASYVSLELTDREKELGAIRIESIGTEIRCVKANGEYFYRTGGGAPCANGHCNLNYTPPIQSTSVDECIKCKERSDALLGLKTFLSHR